MKCDHIRTRKQGDTPFFPNMLNNAAIEVCLKEDVGEAITELKVEILNLKSKNIELQSFHDLHGNVDNYIDKLKAENKLLKEHIANGDVSRITWIDEVIELKQKLENVQASMYADVVDANMENRRLKRALWLSRAERAKTEHLSKIMYSTLFRDFIEKWVNVERKCRAKAEEYK